MAIEIVSFPSYKMVDLSIVFCMFTRPGRLYVDHPKVEPLEIPGKPHQDHPIEGLEENDSRNPHG